MGGCQVGDELILKVYRQGEYQELKLTVEEQISSAQGAQEQATVPQYQQGFPNGRR